MILCIEKRQTGHGYVHVSLCVAHLPGKTCILYRSLSFSVRSPWQAAPRIPKHQHEMHRVLETPPGLAFPGKVYFLQVETKTRGHRRSGQGMLGSRALEPGFLVSNPLYLVCGLGRVRWETMRGSHRAQGTRELSVETDSSFNIALWGQCSVTQSPTSRCFHLLHSQ